MSDLPSPETVRAVLDVVAPNSGSFTVHELPGSYSNHTHLVEIEPSKQRIVIRRYEEANGDCEGKARREFKTLTALQHHQVPVPKPLYLDDTGTLLGSPGIVTAYVAGQPIMAQPESLAWVEKIDVVAKTLAQIHATPYNAELQQFLIDGNAGVTWFLQTGSIPDYMQQHPDGALVWNTVHDLWPHIQPVQPRLVHVDYWSGNLLWYEGELATVLDWEEAGYGDPGLDVAYCRMELFLEGMDATAERFLAVYEAEAGYKVANLGLWELAAAARPMLDLDSWLTRPFMAERFRRFIANAKQTADQSSLL